MDTQFHLEPTSYDQSFFNQEIKPDFLQYGQSDLYQHSFPEAAIPNDFSFLSQNNLYDTVIGSPLDATRQSTDVTDTSEISPINNFNNYPQHPHQQPQQIPFYQNFPFQDFNNSFGNMRNGYFQNQNNNNKFPSHFPKQPIGPFNHPFVNQHPLEAKIHHNPAVQIPLTTQAMPHFEQQQPIKAFQPFIKELEDKDLESDDSEDMMDNPQLKILLEGNLWSGEKDEFLLKLGSQMKFDWKKIAKKFSHKKITPHFLKMRYKELTCAPVQRRVKFNHKEDLMIAKYFEKYGSNWNQMSVHFDNRTAIMLKNRYYSFIRKRDLLPILMSEVRDIERESLDVDTIGIQEAEKYTKSLELKMAYEQNGQNIFSIKAETVENTDNCSLGVVTAGGQIGESQLLTLSNLNSAQIMKQSKEIEILKARIKSLQSLFMKTKSELDNLKSQK